MSRKKNSLSLELVNELLENFNDRTKIIKKINSTLKTKIRQQNFPAEISENIVKYIYKHKFNLDPEWKPSKGDLLVRKGDKDILIEVKSFTNKKGPTSFGPTESWDELYFLDSTNFLNKRFKCYRIKMNSKKFAEFIQVNKKQKFVDQCNQKRRPRISFENICKQLSTSRYKVDLIFDDKLDVLFKKQKNISLIS